MCSLLVILFVNILLFPPCDAAMMNTARLTTLQTSHNGATISIPTGYNTDTSVDNVNNEWDITVTSDTLAQRGYHLQIDLDSTWGFHATQISTIELLIASDTPSAADLDLLVSFSVANSEYFTSWLSVDNAAPTTIYPTESSFATGDVKAMVDAVTAFGSSLRDTKCTGGTGNVDAFMGESNLLCCPTHIVAWPMLISLTNDPINNDLVVTVGSRTWSDWTQTHKYTNKAFATGQGLQIYMAMDDPGEAISFQGFLVNYSYATTSPTSTPTTLQPTTLDPTTSIPSTAPVTALPTTNIPTTMPPTSNIPTTMPPTTMQPTTSQPSNVPTGNPLTRSPSTPSPQIVIGNVPTDATITSITASSTLTDGLNTDSGSRSRDELHTTFIYVNRLYLMLLAAILVLVICVVVCCIYMIKRRTISEYVSKKDEQHLSTADAAQSCSPYSSDQRSGIDNKNIVMTSINTHNIVAIPAPPYGLSSVTSVSPVSGTAFLGNQFEINLSSLAGANCMLMDDVVADMEQHNVAEDEDDVMHGIALDTAGGANIEYREGNGDGEVIGDDETFGGELYRLNNFNIGEDEIIIGDDEIVDGVTTMGNDSDIAANPPPPPPPSADVWL